MKHRLKIGILLAVKFLGGFHLCRFLRRRGLRILCYHGISLEDEYRLDSVLFMRLETFKRRLALLKKWRMNVLPLDEAVKALPRDTHPDHSLVITLDDGWYSTLDAARALRESGFPSTVYVSTYYAENQAPVFNVLVRYLYWKTGGDPAECGRVLSDAVSLDLGAETELCRQTAARLGVKLDPIEESRRFHFMTRSEMRTLSALGMDVQLHTHRHRFPMDKPQATAEIEENRRALKPVGEGPYVHFCFPSGIFQDSQLPWLKEIGVESATTTRSGFNWPHTPLLKLDRFLDGDQVSDLEFEAEICGVTAFFRGRSR